MQSPTRSLKFCARLFAAAAGIAALAHSVSIAQQISLNDTLNGGKQKLIDQLLVNYQPDPNAKAETEWQKVQNLKNQQILAEILNNATNVQFNATTFQETRVVSVGSRNNRRSADRSRATVQPGQAQVIQHRPAPGRHEIIQKRQTVRLTVQQYINSQATEDDRYSQIANQLNVENARAGIPDDSLEQSAVELKAELEKVLPPLKTTVDGKPELLILVIDEDARLAMQTSQAPPARQPRPATPPPQPAAPAAQNPFAALGGLFGQRTPPQPVAKTPTPAPAPTEAPQQSSEQVRRVLMSYLKQELTSDDASVAANAQWALLSGTYDQALADLKGAQANPKRWVDITGDAMPNTQPAQYSAERLYWIQATAITKSRTADQEKAHKATVQISFQLRRVDNPDTTANLLTDPVQVECIFHPARQEFITMETDSTLGAAAPKGN